MGDTKEFFKGMSDSYKKEHGKKASVLDIKSKALAKKSEYKEVIKSKGPHKHSMERDSQAGVSQCSKCGKV